MLVKKSFKGGYIFRRFEGQPRDELVPAGIPEKVFIPSSQGFGSSLKPIVKEGDRVYAGQIIARDDNTVSSPIHASVSGVVVSITKRNYFKREVDLVAIKTDGIQEYKALEGASKEWDKLPISKIEELLYLSGVTALDREGIPTHFKSSLINPEDVEDLIIHGINSEAYNISLETMLGGRNIYNFVEGIKILKKIMPNAKIHLALNKNKLQIIEKIKKLIPYLDKFFIYPLVPKYPQGYDEVLVPTLLGKNFPYGYSAANIGVVVLNIQAVLHVYKAVAEGKPLIERIVALCGPSFEENLHIRVKVGTPLEYILKGRLREGPARIILNSILTGEELDDFSLPIDRTFSQIIAIPEDKERKLFGFLRLGRTVDSYSRAFFSSFVKMKKVPSTNQHGEKRPCIQCGYCIEVCPVRIFPNLIDRYAAGGINDTLMRYGVFNCIECNLCSYVCPSKIPLANNLKAIKKRLIEIGCDLSLCTLPRFNLKGLDEYKGVKKLR